MPWNLRRSYAEACSSKLMCPCNLTSDHGAAYDFCRATPGFTFRDGQIDGIDVRGRKVVGVQQASIELSDDGLRHSVRVGDAIDFEIEDFVPSGSRPVSRSASPACSTRSRRT
ncbi:MAG: uncharacterized protein JWQ26_1109 [Modestobacter sp.]|jgi:hypothetical protein|nr:uncharacterized protein [Modestobacter sp.]